MILKYKLNDSTWKYKSAKDITVSKVDIRDIINKHMDKITGTIIPSDDINEELCDIFCKANIFANCGEAIVNATVDYKTNKFHPEQLLKYWSLLLIDFYNLENRDTIILHSETYLMTDDGKTIERLM